MTNKQPFGGDPRRLFDRIRSSIEKQATDDPLGRAQKIIGLADAVVQEWLGGLTPAQRRAVLDAREKILSEADEWYGAYGIVLGRYWRIRSGPIHYEGEPPLVADAVEAKYHAARWVYLQNSIQFAAEGVDADEPGRVALIIADTLKKRETAYNSLLGRLEGRDGGRAKVRDLRPAEREEQDEQIARAIDGIRAEWQGPKPMSISEAIRRARDRAEAACEEYPQFCKLGGDDILGDRAIRNAYKRAEERRNLPGGLNPPP